MRIKKVAVFLACIGGLFFFWAGQTPADSQDENITIEVTSQVTAPGDGALFAVNVFLVDGGGGELDDIAPGETTSISVPNANFTIRYSLPVGWQADSIQCAGATTEIRDSIASSIRYNVVPSADLVQCTVTTAPIADDDLARISFAKIIEGTDNGDTFAMNMLGIEGAETLSGTNLTGTTTFLVNPGTNYMYERTQREWRAIDFECTGATDSKLDLANAGYAVATATAIAGQSHVCTFTNQLIADIPVEKFAFEVTYQVTDPGNGNEPALSLIVPGSPRVEVGALTPGATESASLPVGNVTLLFTKGTGWKTDSITCDGATTEALLDNANLVLWRVTPADGPVQCTITSSPIPEADLVKFTFATVLDGEDNGDTFTFSLAELDGEEILSGENPTGTMTFVTNPGTNILFQASSDLWQVEDIQCTGNPTLKVRSQPSFGSAEIDAAAGQSYACIFTNKRVSEAAEAPDVPTEETAATPAAQTTEQFAYSPVTTAPASAEPIFGFGLNPVATAGAASADDANANEVQGKTVLAYTGSESHGLSAIAFGLLGFGALAFAGSRTVRRNEQ